MFGLANFTIMFLSVLASSLAIMHLKNQYLITTIMITMNFIILGVNVGIVYRYRNEITDE